MPFATWLLRLRRRVQRVVAPSAHAEALNDELRFHLEMEIEHNVRTGLSPDEARRRASEAMGAHGEFASRTPNDAPPRAPLLETLLRDVRLGARSLGRAPAFSAMAILTIALGIGVTTAVYSAIDGVMLRPLPYPAPDRLVRLYEHSREFDRSPFSGANARDVQRETRTLATVAYVNAYENTVLGANEPLRTRVARVSREFFDVFGVPAARGRVIAPGEGRASGPQVAVVSDRFWREALGADPAFTRRTLRIDDDVYPIAGVMPPTFAYPSRTDVWVSVEDVNPHRTAHNWALVGRLAPGKQLADAQTEIDGLLRRLKSQLGKDIDAEGAVVVGLHADMARSARATLLVLFGAVALVLLVACVNLASANLARGELRHREYAVRTALGAGRARIVRQVLTENLLLAALGGAVGCALAWALTRALVAIGGAVLPRYADVRLDGRVLLFAAVASALTGLLVGAVPAWRVSRDLRGAIGTRGAIDGARLRTRGLLIGTEVAMAVALLAGAGLLMKSLRTLLAEDPGFRSEGVVTADIALPGALYSDTTRIRGYFDQLLPQVRTLPGVAAAGVINAIPIGGNGGNSRFAIDGGEELVGSTDYRVIDSVYFRALRIPLLQGRAFAASDAPGAEHVTVINAAMARKFWPGANPLGHRIRFPGMDSHAPLWLTVVGVVGDVRSEGLDAPAEPAAFVYYPQRPENLGWMATLVVRTDARTHGIGDALRARIRAQDPNVPVNVSTLATLVSASVAPRRFTASVIATFATLALLLAAVGIHGVLAYVVAQRRREIGVRMALGAARGTVRGMVLRDAMRAVLPGVAIGIVVALALGRTLSGLLYGVRPTDPPVLLAVVAVLTLVALGAACLPARRATKVDPLEAMRAD